MTSGRKPVASPPDRGCERAEPRGGPLTTLHRSLSTAAAAALGSNRGDRHAHLEYAVGRLKQIVDRARVSSFFETDAIGVNDQPKFLNSALAGLFSGTPSAFFDALMQIERDRGRERPFPGAARTLDLDLILFGDQIINKPELTIPHPRFRERAFVLQPLAEIAPELVDPVTRRTVRELLEALERRTVGGINPP